MNTSEPAFAKSNDGLVHLISPVEADHTLCGDAFEGYLGGWKLGKDDTTFAWEETTDSKITCEKCLTIIRACKQVRLRKK